MTFQILKPHHPEMALAVRNILEGSRDNTEAFDISLSLAEINTVIAAIEQDMAAISDPGMLMVAHALLGDWQSLVQDWIEVPPEKIDPQGDKMMTTPCGIPLDIEDHSDDEDWKEL